MSQQKIAKTDTRFGNMYYFEDDPTIGRSLKEYGEYCFPEVAIIKNLVHRRAWFIDIGANIGTHTVAIAPFVERVVAFEPNKDCYDLLVRNCSANECYNVTPTPIALGDKSGMCSTEFDYGRSSVVEGDSVLVAPFDSIGIPKSDFIKIDVEGMELEVLRGMEHTLLSRKPYLLVEMMDDTKNPDVYDFLKRFHYNIYWVPVSTYNHDNFKENGNNVFGQQHGVLNWLASSDQLNTLQPVVDRDDTIERLVERSRQNVGNDTTDGG